MIVEADEDERTRIPGEPHNDIVQEVVLVAVELKGCEQQARGVRRQDLVPRASWEKLRAPAYTTFESPSSPRIEILR